MNIRTDTDAKKLYLELDWMEAQYVVHGLFGYSSTFNKESSAIFSCYGAVSEAKKIENMALAVRSASELFRP